MKLLRKWNLAMWMAATWTWSACAAAFAQTAVVTHAELQAVSASGESAWPTNHPFTLRGVIVSDPEEMLDNSYDPGATGPGQLGGQFQIFFQGVNGDRGGTALWMAQNYFFIPGQDYGAEWTNEIRRVMYDANGRKFRKGDLIEVLARQSLPNFGKRNINEGHFIAPENNFDIRLVKANAGLPQAEAIAISNLVASGTSQLFDSTRATGGEHWQGMRVRLDAIRLADTNGWGKTNWADRICTATDGTGRSFPLRMPLTNLGAPPSTTTYFSATGILNQENSYTNGYELFVQEIGPVLNVGAGASGGVAVSFASDYEGYVLEASDDGLQNWGAVDITPVKTIVIEDAGASTNRVYRLRKVD